MWNLVNEYGITVLEVTPEADKLTALYIQEGVISPAWSSIRNL
jgi:hypothetical protein